MLDRPNAPKDEQAAAEGAVEVSSQRINGVVDVSRPGRVVGWAIDRSDPEAAVEVDIYRDGRRVTTVRADRHREDLVRNGIGTGNYGFLVELDPAAEPGMAFAITAIARTADGSTGPLRPIGKAAPSTDPERRILERSFEEIISLRAEVADLRARPSEAAFERLREMLDRIEVVQARLEAGAPATERAQPSAPDHGLRAIAVSALLIALGSLAVGIFSMLGS